MKNLLRCTVPVFFFMASFVLVVFHFDNENLIIKPSENTPARSGALEALEFWTHSRAYPYPDISPDKHYKGYIHSKRNIKEFRRSIQSTSSWIFIGPTNLSGRMTSVAFNPLNGNTVYSGSASGGLWRSYTGGLAGDWQRISTGYPVLGVNAIAIHPTDSNTIYIGTGEVYRYQGAVGGTVIRTTRGSYGMGLLKTTDGGATWIKSLDWSYNQQQGVQAIEINPLNPQTVWAATTEATYKSPDAGSTWIDVLPVPLGQDIVINTNDTNQVLVSCGNFGYAAGVYRTTDGGNSWTQVGIPDFSGKTLLEKYKANPNIVYASVADSTTSVTSLWKSTDFGANWTLLNTSGISGVQGWYSHFVAVHPTDSVQVVHAGVSISKSTNGGTTFSGSGGSYADHHGYAHHPTDPNILYVANDDGIYRSTNFGTSYEYVSVGLHTGQFYGGFSCSATDSLIALGQVQDHIPGYLYTGSLSWLSSAVDEVGWTAIDQINDFIMYAMRRSGNGLSKSTDRGASFFNSSSGISGGVRAWNSPFVVSPSNPSILYFGRSIIFKSTNAASNWFATNSGVALDGNPALSMAISHTNPDTVYVGTAPLSTRAHVFRSTNGGTTWTDVTGTLPDRYPNDIAVDPIDSRIVYVAFGGFSAGHVFKSTNAGGSWIDMTGILPDVPATAVTVDPLNSNFVYVGNDIGVYISANGGTIWNSFNDGLPEAVLVSDLVITPSNRTLRAATHGNSVYERKLPSDFPSLVLVTPNGGESWEATTTQLITWSQALVTLMKLEYSTDDGASWITIADSVPASSKSYNWTVPLTLTSLARVRISALENPLLSEQSDGVFTIFYTGVAVPVSDKWNLVSLPVVVTDSRTSVVYPTAFSDAYAYEGTYAVKETLTNGPGYWLKFEAAQVVPIRGDSITTDTIDVVEGWNLIGSISSIVEVSNVGSMPGGIVTSNFFGYNAGYHIADSIQPGKGYWVKASQPGKLILSSSSAVNASSRIKIVATAELPPPPPELSISNLKPLTPNQFMLERNYPNPFNPKTVIRYQVSVNGQAKLNVYDALGREVATLVNEVKEAGVYTVEWDASGLPSGVYVYRLTAGGSSQARKMLLVR
ncbi:MAG: T9SS type A sorting domain-containing protein [Ignavibacteriae bacterium]|nr:T9SS type A sorting domain-containing protein [Ignavibacteriota bacterium]